MVSKKKIYILSIAGSDSSSGAGIQADLKTVLSLGGYCTVSITSITAQNKNKVSKIYNLNSDLVIDQIKSVMDDFDIKGIKIGLVNSTELSKKISNHLKKYNIPIVVDPVFVSSSGFEFIEKSNYKVSQVYLSNHAKLLTPNVLEAEILSGLKIKNNLKKINESLYALYKKFQIPILIKSVYVEKKNIFDILYDGNEVKMFKHKMVDVAEFHGTGCTLSSAICFYLANGNNLEDSIFKARKYLLASLKRSKSLDSKGYLSH